MTTQIPGRHPELVDVCVADAMHPGVLTCPREAPLRDVARMLASYNVHCIVVFGSEEEHEDGEERPWAVISDLDLVAAALAGGLDEHTAGGAAGSPVVLISGRETLGRAAQLMTGAPDEPSARHRPRPDATSRDRLDARRRGGTRRASRALGPAARRTAISSRR